MAIVAVIDYGMGNLHSVSKALERVAGGTRVRVSQAAAEILDADRVVLPGVGAMRDCMGELRRLGLDGVVRECAASRPFLGVCVGMQALLDFSEENDGTPCLGLIPGTVRRFPAGLADPGSGERLKIPHMGWNRVHQAGAHPLWRDIPQDSRFYFVHSYYAEPASPDLVAAATGYGIEFAAAVTRGNIFAVQFHPEKSQHAGLRFYENFLSWDGAS